MTEYTLAEHLIRTAEKHGVTVAVAESLTGGALASEIVSVPGASAVFLGGAVCYHADTKASLLGVSEDLLADHGPVHGEVAKQMATGVRKLYTVAGTPATLGIATTGVAGPAPDPATGQPAGTVWIGVSYADSEAEAYLFRFTGGRSEVRGLAVRAALKLALATLEMAIHRKLESH